MFCTSTIKTKIRRQGILRSKKILWLCVYYGFIVDVSDLGKSQGIVWGGRKKKNKVNKPWLNI